MKKILVLGAGMVARPLVRYLLKQGFYVTVASRTLIKAEKIVNNHPKGTAQELDINNETKLTEEIKNSDLVLSLLPYIYHVKIAKLCIKYGKNMVTTSYVSNEMRALDNLAKLANIIILNEVGLDPGIDHMSAMKIIHDVKNNNGKIMSFISSCGGLPAPDANTNPFGYKFSWSPRGVVLAAKNSASYLKDGIVVNVPGEELFANYSFKKIEGIGELEAYPNRDSLQYIKIYNIPNVKTMQRCTFRYPGWCDTWKKISELGLLDEKVENLEGMTYKDFLKKLVKYKEENNLEKKVANYLNIDENSKIIKNFEYLDLFSDKQIPIKEESALDILTALLLEKLQYEKGERDMVILHHEFIAEYENLKERITSTLIDFGIPGGDTSMARTVGLPAAICAKLIAEEKINIKGVHIPVLAEIYEPVLKELELKGIVFKEKCEIIKGC